MSSSRPILLGGLTASLILLFVVGPVPGDGGQLLMATSVATFAALVPVILAGRWTGLAAIYFGFY